MTTTTMHQFLAGAATADITPPLGTKINGDFITHYATQIHDRLFAKALVLQKDNRYIALVVVDICTMPKVFLDEVKAIIKEQTGISTQDILISSTHTHAAGSVSAVHLTSEDAAYKEMLPPLIVSAVQEAIKRLKPAKIAYGAVEAPEHVTCRRYFMKPGYTPIDPVSGTAETIKTNPFGAEPFIEKRAAVEDAGLSFLAVKGNDGEWISILANYSLHYVGDWPNGTISSDYFGAFAQEMKGLIGAKDDFVGIMSNGTSGDVNIWDFLNPERYPSAYFEKGLLIARQLAERVYGTFADLQWEEDPALDSAHTEIPVKVDKPDAKVLERARQLVANVDYDNFDMHEGGIEKLYAREQELLNAFDDFLLCPVQAMRIGSGRIGALAGEFFAETGLWLKENVKPEHYFTIGLANGNLGYVPPKREFALGGYETWRCRYSCLVPDTEDKVKQTLLELVRSI